MLFFCHFSYTEQKDSYVWDLKPEYEKKKSRNWDICDRTDHNCGASKKLRAALGNDPIQNKVGQGYILMEDLK